MRALTICFAAGQPAANAGLGALATVSDTVPVRMTEFWRRMRAHFGDAYAESFARDHVMAELDHRTVEEALREGESAKDVWRAVCAAMNLPASER